MNEVGFSWRQFISRKVADVTGAFCLQNSLVEAALANGLPAKNLKKILPKPTIDSHDYFEAIFDGAEYLGMQISKIYAAEALVNNPNIIIGPRVKEKLETSRGEFMLSGSNIRVMFHEKKGGGFKCHAECDDNSRRSRLRIDKLEKEGWFSGAIVEVRKKE